MVESLTGDLAGFSTGLDEGIAVSAAVDTLSRSFGSGGVSRGAGALAGALVGALVDEAGAVAAFFPLANARMSAVEGRLPAGLSDVFAAGFAGAVLADDFSAVDCGDGDDLTVVFVTAGFG